MALPAILVGGAILLAILATRKKETEYRVKYYRNGKKKSETLRVREDESIEINFPLATSILPRLPNPVYRMMNRRSLRKYCARELGISVTDIVKIEELT